MKYSPDWWEIIEVKTQDGPLYKVFASFCGGYLDGDYWRLNSGIASIEVRENCYVVYGYSRSHYFLNKSAQGTSVYGNGVLTRIINDNKDIVSLLTHKQAKELLENFKEK